MVINLTSVTGACCEVRAGYRVSTLIMNPSDYTDEQRKDIEERVSKAKVVLTELHLQPSAQVYKIALDDNTFADKVIPYLQDTKYSGVLSPIQHEDTTEN